MKNALITLILIWSSTGFSQNPGDALFGAAQVHDLQIYFSQPDYWDSLTYYYEQIEITGGKTYMKADSVVIDGTVLLDVGVRLKGNSAYNWAANQGSVKLPFKLDFNKYVSGQKYDDLKKLNLHNEDRDPSLMRSKIISDFLIEQGVPAPRITYTRNSINGVYWGLYTMVEQLDKTFLSTNFSDNDSNLYKALPRYPGWEPAGGSTLEYLGDLPSDYDNIYELKTNGSENNWSGFTNLLYQINNTSAAEFKDSLEAVMNTDSYLKAWATMSLFVNFDAYPFLGNNYYMYDDPVDGKFHWIAWDFNLGIGTARQGMSIAQAEAVSVLFVPQNQGARPLANRMLDDPYYHTRYLTWVCQFAQNSFDISILSPKIDSLADMIRTDLYADVNKFYSNGVFEESFDFNLLGFPGLKPFITNRRAAVLNELQTLGCPVLGVTEPPRNSITCTVFPNPFSEVTTVQVSGLNGNEWSLILYNSTGQVLHEAAGLTGSQTTIDRKNLAAGIYFYQVNTGTEPMATGKLVIE